MLKTQLILLWISVFFYVVAASLTIAGSWFSKPNWRQWSYVVAWLGLVPQTAALLLRWYQTGHFPYWGTYEVYTSYAWGAALLIQLFSMLVPAARSIVGWLWPVVFLMIGLGAMGTKEIEEIPRTFYTFWLGVHIFFAKLSYGSALIAAGLGGAFLWRRKTADPAELERLDRLNYSVSGFAFIMLGIMILSGSIWAYKAWGAYWRWDPIETWALISWLVYGIALHLRFSWGWQGVRAAWLSIAALLLILFAFFGIPLFYPTAHEHLTY